MLKEGDATQWAFEEHSSAGFALQCCQRNGERFQKMEMEIGILVWEAGVSVYDVNHVLCIMQKMEVMYSIKLAYCFDQLNW